MSSWLAALLPAVMLQPMRMAGYSAFASADDERAALPVAVNGTAIPDYWTVVWASYSGILANPQGAAVNSG